MELVAKRKSVQLLCASVLLFWAGCKTPAPLHVWRTPKLQPADHATLAVATPVGPQGVAGRLEQAILAAAPAHRQLRLVPQRQLAQQRPNRQASAVDSPPSDIEALQAARAADVDLLLYGEILHDPAEERRRAVRDARVVEDAKATRIHELRVAWRLFDVRRNRALGGDAQRHASVRSEPSLAGVPTAADVEDERAIFREAAEGALSLVAPHVAETEVALAQPWIGRGAAAVRAGNALAAQGEWSAAEQRWQQALDQNPRQHAAVHNLAYAALAREDYAEARRLAREASGMAGRQLYETTAVWIETQWREAHRAIGVAPPPGGWYFAPPSEQPRAAASAGTLHPLPVDSWGKGT